MTLPVLRNGKYSPVAADHLVFLLIEIVVRKLPAGMRYSNSRHTVCFEVSPNHCLIENFTELPVVIKEYSFHVSTLSLL